MGIFGVLELWSNDLKKGVFLLQHSIAPVPQLNRFQEFRAPYNYLIIGNNSEKNNKMGGDGKMPEQDLRNALYASFKNRAMMFTISSRN